MKKFLALITVFTLTAAFCGTAMAKAVDEAEEKFDGDFASVDYINGFDTVPAFYTGTLKYDGKFSAPLTCKYVSAKGSIPAYMALCIPCLKCFYSCAFVDGTDDVNGCLALPSDKVKDTEPLTGYLYYITHVDKKNKEMGYMELELGENAWLFNYGASSKDKQVAFVIGSYNPELPMLAMAGEKDSKNWKMCLADNGGKKANIALTMPKSFDGYAFFNFIDITTTYGFGTDDCSIAEDFQKMAYPGFDEENWSEDGTTTAGFFGNGTISLKRDDSKTKTIMSWMCGFADECYYYDGAECEEVIGDAFQTLIIDKSYNEDKWYVFNSEYLFEDLTVRSPQMPQ